jgi:hypothetical protein
METDRTPMVIGHGVKVVAEMDMVMQTAVEMMNPQRLSLRHVRTWVSLHLPCAAALLHALPVADFDRQIEGD